MDVFTSLLGSIPLSFTFWEFVFGFCVLAIWFWLCRVRITVPKHERCARCKYWLTGLHRDARCPECGSAIRVTVEQQFRNRYIRRLGTITILWLSGAIAILHATAHMLETSPRNSFIVYQPYSLTEPRSGNYKGLDIVRNKPIVASGVGDLQRASGAAPIHSIDIIVQVVHPSYPREVYFGGPALRIVNESVALPEGLTVKFDPYMVIDSDSAHILRITSRDSFDEEELVEFMSDAGVTLTPAVYTELQQVHSMVCRLFRVDSYRPSPSQFAIRPQQDSYHIGGFVDGSQFSKHSIVFVGALVLVSLYVVSVRSASLRWYRQCDSYRTGPSERVQRVDRSPDGRTEAD